METHIFQFSDVACVRAVLLFLFTRHVSRDMCVQMGKADVWIGVMIFQMVRVDVRYNLL